jgi:hypothetical protein
MAIPQKTAAFGKLFDVHFEIGSNPIGNYYARTVLGVNGLMFEQSGPTPKMAIERLAADMENNSFWALIIANPAMSSYPFSTTTPPSVRPGPPAKKPDPNVVRELPSELTQVAHPDCQPLCTSFDHFGKTKCKSMCGQRTGL